MTQEKRWAFMSKKIIGHPSNPMLIRWRLIQTPLFGIYLHLIHREDLDRLPHDHPWTFWTWIIRGWYEEELFPDTRLLAQQMRDIEMLGPVGGYHGRRKRWSFRKFSQQSAHRIVAVHGKVTTLVLVGPKTRTWGFYDGFGNFIDWRDYHGITERDSDAAARLAMG